LKISDKVGHVVSVKKVKATDDIIIVSNKGQLIRTPAAPISEIGRATQGVRVISMDDGETVQGVAVVAEEVVVAPNDTTPSSAPDETVH
jgi:DNA gyrase subunit A